MPFECNQFIAPSNKSDFKTKERSISENSTDPAITEVVLLVVSCDAYKDLWQSFFICLFKYWPDCPYTIYLGSNTSEYPDPRVRPILVGKDIDYSSNLSIMLGQIRQRWIIFWIEDRVLSSPVNTDRIVNIIRSAQNQRAGFLKLIGNHPLAYSKNGIEEYGEIPKGARYRACLTVGLWDKHVLLRLLRPGETAWEIELKGSRRSVEFEEKFFTINARHKDNPPISTQHLVIKGKLIRNAQSFLEKENLRQFVQRPLESIRTFWYVKIYIAIMDIIGMIKQLKKKWLS